MIQENEILVIDDFIDLKYQEQIKNILIGQETFKYYDFPWFLIEDVTAAYSSTDSQKRPALVHSYVEWDGESPGIVRSEFHDLFVKLLEKAASKLGLKKIKALQGRSFLQFPLNLKNRNVDTPHIDIYSRKHIVVLYYACDSDGDTIIYNERKESETYTIKQRITPKQGRVVIFDGWLMHTAEQPINNIRCVVNYNIE